MRKLAYRPGTESGPFSQHEFDSFERMLRIDATDFKFDQNYVQFIRSQNGGEPLNKYFQVREGEWMPVDRILNFAEFASSSPEDQLLNVHQVWNAIEERLNPKMFPFAAISGGDFLIFDGSGGISLWYHEKSSEGSPFLKRIAGSFLEFLSLLRETPSRRQ